MLLTKNKRQMQWYNTSAQAPGIRTMIDNEDKRVASLKNFMK